RGRDHEPLRRRAHDRADRRGSRGRVRCNGARARREGIRRARDRAEVARGGRADASDGGGRMSAVPPVAAPPGAAASKGAAAGAAPAAQKIGPPLWLLCELTYRCPLHCVFCYNPVDMRATGPELTTEDWLRVLREARALG